VINCLSDLRVLAVIHLSLIQYADQTKLEDSEAVSL
jgi:hypothetical protein